MVKFNSIKNQIISTILVCFLVPFLFQMVLVTTLVNTLFEDKVIKKTQINLENSALNVSSALQAQFDMAWFYKNDQFILEAARQLGSAEENTLTTLQRNIATRLLVENNLERYSYPFYFVILDYAGNMMTNYTHSPFAQYDKEYQIIAEEAWFQRLQSSYTQDTVMFSAEDLLSSFGPKRLYVAINIFDEDNIGILIIAVDEKAITAQLTSPLPQGTSFLVSQEGECLFTSVEKTLDYSKDIFNKVEQMNEIIDKGELVSTKIDGVEKSRYLLMSHKIVVKGYTRDWRIISVAPMSELTSELTQIKMTNFIVFLFYLLSIVWVLFLLNRNIIKPILTIRNAVNEVTSGNLNIKIKKMKYNELGELGAGFNSMVQSLDGLFKDITDREQQKRKIEIMLLQNQIKPHFVRNVLNTIRWLAEINGATSVSKSIMALNFMLEYNFKDSETLSTVSDELMYVKKYSYLQKLRFQNKFKDEYDVDEEILTFPLLKLSLQPIVENCIYHGILKKEGLGTISITGHKKENRLEIIISDDGVGMPRDILETILIPKKVEVNEEFNNSKNIALWNIDQRIKKLYGSEFGLSIASQPMNGTQITCTFPLLEV